MQKIIWTGLFLAVNLASGKAPVPDPRWGIIGPDFGVLDNRDLKANACRFKPEPFPPPRSSNFLYWRCFETKNAGWAFDKDPADDSDEGIPILTAREGLNREEYLFQRAWPIAEYRGVLRSWKKLARHAAHVCVLGTYISTEANPEGGQTRSWLFSKYKTRKGCEAYFGGECDTRKAIRENCKAPAH